MNFRKAINTVSFDIGYLVACEGYTEEDAKHEVMDHLNLEQMIEAVGKRKCKTEGHRYVDNGTYAGPEGAAEHFSCARCGHSFNHIYF